jgi:hypothetical protein
MLRLLREAAEHLEGHVKIELSGGCLAG